ncbi:EF-hand domain-containing protein [Streptomyces drozdowiczii]|uniref:EF-hand domain-containing protein n=1 Tax=Streptomyces drozdowiczii TaxID=202862 RepID=A0ABY6Q0F1_9ACTN|nr:EF-hand domain-containing protein [Streptomyces drozdowiczii]MCX0241996.1 EF-hand domain-containing protein [Streptomyces drozdowiczii]UZK57898.1 EF-hand domain-containing protein [Streptomyces drozdowiczii]
MRAEAVERVRLVFTLFDADGNGAIEADDFELMARRVTAAVPEAGAEKRDAMVTAFRTFWKALAENADTNRDGKVDPEEFRTVVLDPQRFGPALAEFAGALTGVADPDGDGLVERETFMAVMAAIGFAQPNTRALFDALEPVGTEQVAVPAWSEAIREFYTPDATGVSDHLVGQPVG